MRMLFIYAHLDDETILSYGTILKFASQGYKISICIVCGNGRVQDEKSSLRMKAFKENFKDLENVELVSYPINDLTLTKENLNLVIDDVFQKFDPQIVVTHSVHDLHDEHQMISRAILVKCRKTDNKVNCLMTTVSTVSSWTFQEYGNFIPNTYVDISDYIRDKLNALENYKNELPCDDNDLRSADAVLTWNKHFGNVMHVEYCEPYQQIFAKV